MKVKYQITMEVEVDVETLNDKVVNKWTERNLGIIAETGFRGKGLVVGKAKVERIGRTGVTPQIKRPFSNRACRRKLHDG